MALLLTGGGLGVDAAAPAGPLDPDDVPGLVLWFSPESTMLQADGGAAAALGDDPVGRWQDQSGNARHLDVTGAVAGRRPLLKLAALNGHRVLEFDNTDDQLTTVSFTTIPQPWTLAIVCKVITIRATDNITSYMITSASGAATEMSVGNSSVQTVTGLSNVGAWALYVVRFNGASSKLRQNGTDFDVPGSVGTTGLSILRLGSTNASLACHMQMAECCAWDSLITDNQVAGLALGFNAKYLLY